jgi:hypothetical protein
MGNLYNAAMLVRDKSKQQLKEKWIREELAAAGVTDHMGKPIQDCSYEEIKSEMVLLTFRRIDTDKPEGKWF